MGTECQQRKRQAKQARECCSTSVLQYRGHVHIARSHRQRLAELVLLLCFQALLHVRGDGDSPKNSRQNDGKGEKGANTEKAILVWKEKGEKKSRGKVSGAGLAFFPLISCNSPNHNDRRRAIDGESEQGKGEIWANGRNRGRG